MPDTPGRIHSLDSFGTHEGPGIRYVVFMQGCAARCRYCHNPDTWGAGEGQAISAAEIFKKIRACIPYFQASGGGVTASGGEPLLQPDFLRELFTLCRREGIHTAVETAGFIPGRALESLDDLIGLTDLFIVDLKWADPRRHRELTGHDLAEPLALLETLERRARPYWLRQVLVPGLNDAEPDLLALKEILASLKHCQRFEFLPYHTLGLHKWEALGRPYTLTAHRPATDGDIERAMRIIGRS